MRQLLNNIFSEPGNETMNIGKHTNILLVAALLTAPAVSHADPESHEAAANALLDSMNMSSLLTESIEVMLQLELQNNPAMRPYADTMRQFFERYMGAESLRPEIARLYVEAFTEKELNEITAFYSTPTGQKVLTATPELMAKGAALGQQRVMENIDDLRYMIEEESKRITELQNQN